MVIDVHCRGCVTKVVVVIGRTFHGSCNAHTTSTASSVLSKSESSFPSTSNDFDLIPVYSIPTNLTITSLIQFIELFIIFHGYVILRFTFSVFALNSFSTTGLLFGFSVFDYLL